MSRDFGARTAHSFLTFRRSACYMRLNICELSHWDIRFNICGRERSRAGSTCAGGARSPARVLDKRLEEVRGAGRPLRGAPGHCGACGACSVAAGRTRPLLSARLVHGHGKGVHPRVLDMRGMPAGSGRDAALERRRGGPGCSFSALAGSSSPSPGHWPLCSAVLVLGATFLRLVWKTKIVHGQHIRKLHPGVTQVLDKRPEGVRGAGLLVPMCVDSPLLAPHATLRHREGSNSVPCLPSLDQ